MTIRCDMKDCFELALYGLSLYASRPGQKESEEVFDFDLCEKHYRRLRGRIKVSVEGT